MSDNCFCTLYLKDDATPELAQFLLRSMGNPSETQARRFAYEEVSWGTLEPSLKRYLMANNILFAWVNESGHDFGAGALIYDGANLHEVAQRNGDIVLTVDQALDAAKLVLARQLQAFLSEVIR